MAAPDEKERTGVAIAGTMQRRGIAVAVVWFDVTEERPLDRAAREDVAEVVRELARRAPGEQLGAALVTRLALEPRFGLDPAKLRGVIAFNGVFEAPLVSLVGAARADALPFLVLSAHADSLASAQSSRLLVRALERAGAKNVHGHFVSLREAHTLTHLSGEKNDVEDVVAAFVRKEPRPGNAETAWALADAWGSRTTCTARTRGSPRRSRRVP